MARVKVTPSGDGEVGDDLGGFKEVCDKKRLSFHVSSSFQKDVLSSKHQGKLKVHLSAQA